MGTTNNSESLNNFIPNKYEFVISGAEDVIFNVNSGNLPGISTNAVPTHFRKTAANLSGDRVTVNDVTLNFLLDEQFLTYKTAHAWLISSINSNDSDQRDITILLKTAQNNASVTVRLINAIPTSLGDIELSSVDDSLEAIIVPFNLTCDRLEIL